jgi:hypothetical protein
VNLTGDSIGYFKSRTSAEATDNTATIKPRPNSVAFVITSEIDTPKYLKVAADAVDLLYIPSSADSKNPIANPIEPI